MSIIGKPGKYFMPTRISAWSSPKLTSQARCAAEPVKVDYNECSPPFTISAREILHRRRMMRRILVFLDWMKKIYRRTVCEKLNLRAANFGFQISYKSRHQA